MTTKEFTEGWKHFCDCMDFGKSAMDADAIRFMNEAPSKIIQCLDSQPDLLAICEEFMDISAVGSAAFDDPLPGSIFLRAEAAIAKARPSQ